jgi:hypothetical protein
MMSFLVDRYRLEGGKWLLLLYLGPLGPRGCESTRFVCRTKSRLADSHPPSPPDRSSTSSPLRCVAPITPFPSAPPIC